MGCSPWGDKRVWRDSVAKQQRHTDVNKKSNMESSVFGKCHQSSAWRLTIHGSTIKALHLYIFNAKHSIQYSRRTVPSFQKKQFFFFLVSFPVPDTTNQILARSVQGFVFQYYILIGNHNIIRYFQNNFRWAHFSKSTLPILGFN